MPSEKKTYEERLFALQEKQKQLKTQEKKLKSQHAEVERRQRTKHLVEMGAAVYSVLGDSFREGDIEKMVAFLKAQDQRGGYFSSAMGRTEKGK